MAINWYPGHMHKACKKIKEAMPKVDLIIEVMDARIPYSSENPAVASLRGDRPCLKILNKADLADPKITQQWIEYFEQEKAVQAIAISADQKGQAKKLPDLLRKFGPKRDFNLRPLRLMIMGIPNVGKSTLINALAGKTIAKVGNEPAVTKAQQRIVLGNGMVLSDTPGILWPRFEDENSGYRLAVTGAIKNTAIEYEDIAMYAADFFLRVYPNALTNRYKLKELPETDVALLEAIGRKRGALRPRGIIDMHKASEVLLHDYRSGALGRLSMETPEMIKVNLAVAQNTEQTIPNDEH